MTLLEMKKKILRLIEEISDANLTDDPDIREKINDVINQVQFELARMKKIPAKAVIEVTEDTRETDLNTLPLFYQLERIVFRSKDGKELRAEVFGPFILFPAEGTATVYYYKYPERITRETADEEYVFTLSEDALEILPYGVAADLLKSDVSAEYGAVYGQRYETMLQRLDPRYSLSSIYIEGGADI